MHLSQLILNPYCRQVQREHRTPYQTHRTIMNAFPGCLLPDERVLFRWEDEQRGARIRLLVQSVSEPDWSFLTDRPGDYLLGPVQRKPFNPVFSVGQVLAFRLRANPTVKRGGKRYGLLREEEQLAWLVHKGVQGGFSLLTNEVRTQERGFVRDWTQREQPLSLLSVQFDGLLRVTDPVLFLQTIRNGVGSGKGIGFGLLSVAPFR